MMNKTESGSYTPLNQWIFLFSGIPESYVPFTREPPDKIEALSGGDIHYQLWQEQQEKHQQQQQQQQQSQQPSLLQAQQVQKPRQQPKEEKIYQRAFFETEEEQAQQMTRFMGTLSNEQQVRTFCLSRHCSPTNIDLDEV